MHQVGELIDQRLVGGRQRQLVFRQIDLRTLAQHLVDRRIQVLSWASWHSIRVIASDLTFSSPSDTLPSPLKPLHILPDTYILPVIAIFSPKLSSSGRSLALTAAVDAGQHEAMMLQLFRTGGHLTVIDTAGQQHTCRQKRRKFVHFHSKTFT